MTILLDQELYDDIYHEFNKVLGDPKMTETLTKCMCDLNEKTFWAEQKQNPSPFMRSEFLSFRKTQRNPEGAKERLSIFKTSFNTKALKDLSEDECSAIALLDSVLAK